MPPSVFPGDEPNLAVVGPARRCLRFAVAMVVILIVWLGVLPQLARTQMVSAMVARNQAFGIDPSAKFYSELPGMPLALIRAESARRREQARPDNSREASAGTPVVP